jgi:hypothetical protein
LRVELSKDTSKVKIPPFTRFLREVTDEKEYETWSMANKDYAMPENDQVQIQ